MSRYSKQRARKKYLLELARQSILKFAPPPITQDEINDFNSMTKFKRLVWEISHALYHAPGLTTSQRKFDHVPKKSIRQLLIEFEKRLNSNTCLKK